MEFLNPFTLTDLYKTSHKDMYPENMSYLYSYMMPRKAYKECDSVTVFGVQYAIQKYIKKLFDDAFFNISWEHFEKKHNRTLKHLVRHHAKKIDHIKTVHELGYLPIHIKALPEGTQCPVTVPYLSINSTHPDAYWLPNYLETLLCCVLWMPTTNATIARNIRKTLVKYANLTGTELGFVDFQGHDFSFRGMSSIESGLVSGSSHLLYFKGTDTTPCADWIEKYYFANLDDLSLDKQIGSSIPASEHSVMCAGTEAGELDTFKRIMSLYPNEGEMVGIVSDTWNLPRVLSEYLPQLGIGDTFKGKLVIRPDSYWTTPADGLLGYSGYHEKIDLLTESEKEVIKLGIIPYLYKKFGGTVNKKGFIELNKHIGIISGESTNPKNIEETMDRLTKAGYASSNIVWGIGSTTYQNTNRDFFGISTKASYGIVNGEARLLYKDPITDSGFKKSAKGLLKVEKVNGTLKLRQNVSMEEESNSELRTVFLNGVISNIEDYYIIKERANELHIS